MTPTDTIYNHWNSKKQHGSKWKSHRLLLPHVQTAIQQAIRKYSVEIIKEAIDNYAKVLLGREFTWSHAWTLYEFLTRHKPAERKELQLYRWIDFYEEEYYSDKYKKYQQQEHKKERKRQDDRDELYGKPTERLQEMRKDRWHTHLYPVIDEILAERALL